ncbi:lamin tail domain-containing protein [Actinoplanes sp. NEAU-A12]|uniref:Lamin tail domain-containing protein n=1 Tax=Actinoplanes sandaracinus TaxID=3045177 RepID=A0ABT6WDW1_9ACTN|nr:lamin tail domain-containing protein [Actinoplanes sandaracinus]MDI6097917.1 lamin tail domain-containing protein [Actinoplanes sandaracinus]
MGTALGVLIAGTGVFGTAPAWAAAPTFDTPPSQTGWGDVVLTGTATPGASVTLRERAYKWGKDVTNAAELEPAEAYDHPTTVTANATTGRWSITRTMDSGFVWAVAAGGEYSRIVAAPLKIGGTLTLGSTASNTVAFSYRASPDEPGLPVTIQRQNGSAWVTVGTGTTDDTSASDPASDVTTTLTGQPAGAQTYRAVVASAAQPAYASPDNLILANTFTGQVTVAGTGGGSTPPPATTPPTANPTTPPTTTPPTNPPTTNPPTTNPPATPAVGSIQFTRVNYNAAGVDRRTNTSINGEYARLTNKSKKAVNLKGWTVRDAAGNLYRFTTNYTLAAGKSVTVRTGKGSNTTATRYWGRSYHVWNNAGDTAALRTGAGKLIDSCKWTKAGKGYTTC